eukprot:TRINITY_DN1697_c0_g1_i1.p1 TRINITY_DN1697_c0_g1~~TRINITY_DN1697_c0_g1_i1.p1  ORF type:complete len:432 (-),score=80.80 TRINITY_DN1697_c0_g1_i1:53-1348(-)
MSSSYYPRSLAQWREKEKQRKREEEHETRMRDQKVKEEQLLKERQEREEKARLEKEEKKEQPIVFDNGAYTIKAGFAPQNYPEVSVPTLIGRPMRQGPMVQPVYVGYEAQVKERILKLKCPIDNGHITNVDDMEQIWLSVYDKLKANPEEHPAVLTEKPFMPNKIRESMSELFFEKFNVPSMYFGLSAVFSMYALGTITGLVIESGESFTMAIPVFEGKIETAFTRKLDIGGGVLTDYLKDTLAKRGYVFNKYAERELVRDIKNKLCYLPLDCQAEYERAMADPSSVNAVYKMPDGQEITLGVERFQIPEALFQPYHLGEDKETAEGLHELIYNSIMKCDMTIRKSLWHNVLLTGGTTLLPGLVERLDHELQPKARVGMKLVAPADRKFSAFFGACMFASHSSFPKMAISKEQYSEVGKGILERFNTEFKD